VSLPPEVDDPSTELSPTVLLRVLRDICLHYFPALSEGALDHDAQK
jgi:hypothetical protein